MMSDFFIFKEIELIAGIFGPKMVRDRSVI